MHDVSKVIMLNNRDVKIAPKNLILILAIIEVLDDFKCWHCFAICLLSLATCIMNRHDSGCAFLL